MLSYSSLLIRCIRMELGNILFLIFCKMINPNYLPTNQLVLFFLPYNMIIVIFLQQL